MEYRHISKCEGVKGCKCKDCLAAERLRYNRSVNGVITNFYYRMKGAGTKLTKAQFKSWFMSQAERERISSDWERSGYEKRLAPSLRRYDTSLEFSERNMYLTTQGGEPSEDAVVQISQSGEVLNTYSDAGHASKCTGVAEADILGAAKGLLVYGGAWHWALAKDFIA